MEPKSLQKPGCSPAAKGQLVRGIAGRTAQCRWTPELSTLLHSLALILLREATVQHAQNKALCRVSEAASLPKQSVLRPMPRGAAVCGHTGRVCLYIPLPGQPAPLRLPPLPLLLLHSSSLYRPAAPR